MTHVEKAKIILPLIQAIIDGKTIQFRNKDLGGNWTDLDFSDEYGGIEFYPDASDYRIKFQKYDNLTAAVKDGWHLIPCVFFTKYTYWGKDGVIIKEDDLIK